jgi:glucosamine-phosphate N-acetyltransferase
VGIFNLYDMGKLEIRKAKFEDLDGIAELLTESFDKTKPATRYWWRIMENPKIHTYVIEDGDIIVGTATLYIMEKLIHSGSYVGQIEDVCVSERYGGQGLGQKLVQRLIDESKELKCYKVVLNCSEDLVKFYEKSGFYQKEVQMRFDLRE